MARLSPQKNKNIKIKFKLGDRPIKQINKIEIENLDKKSLFEQILSRNQKGDKHTKTV